MRLNPIGLHLPDEDRLTQRDIAAAIDLRPDHLTILRYNWDDDKGAAEQTMHVVRELGHKDLLVRYHEYAIPSIDPGVWARRCADLGAIYEPLRREGVNVHCIPANEGNLVGRASMDRAEAIFRGAKPSINTFRVEGGHRDWGSHADWMYAFARAWRQYSGDLLHLPAPSRARLQEHEWKAWAQEHGQDPFANDPNRWNEAMAYWRAMVVGSVHLEYDVVDVHGYVDDTERSVYEMRSVLGSGKPAWLTETNRVAMARLVAMISGGLIEQATWFILHWRNYGPGGVIPEPRPDDDHMSLLHFTDIYEEFKALREGHVAYTVPPYRDQLTGDATIEYILAHAADKGVPADMLLGICKAESDDLNTHAVRWGTSPGGAWTREAEAAIGRQDWATVQEILNRIAASDAPNDVSFGVTQHIVKYAEVGNGTMELQNVLNVRSWFFDPDNACHAAAMRLRGYIANYGHTNLALYAHNRPNDPHSVAPSAKRRYDESWAWAKAKLGAAPPPPPPPPPDPPPPPPPPPPIEPPPQSPSINAYEHCLKALWSYLTGSEEGYGPAEEGNGLYKAWRARRKPPEGAVYGPPITQEVSTPGGAPEDRAHMAFASGHIVRWNPEGPEEV